MTDENEPESTDGKDDWYYEYVVHNNAEELETRQVVLDRMNTRSLIMEILT